jgi:hypothetical protein
MEFRYPSRRSSLARGSFYDRSYKSLNRYSHRTDVVRIHICCIIFRSELCLGTLKCKEVLVNGDGWTRPLLLHYLGFGQQYIKVHVVGARAWGCGRRVATICMTSGLLHEGVEYFLREVMRLTFVLTQGSLEAICECVGEPSWTSMSYCCYWSKRVSESWLHITQLVGSHV